MRLRSGYVFGIVVLERLIGRLATVEKADLGTSAEEKAVLMVAGKIKFIGKVQRNIDVVQFQVLPGVNGVFQQAGGRIIVLCVFLSF